MRLRTDSDNTNDTGLDLRVGEWNLVTMTSTYDTGSNSFDEIDLTIQNSDGTNSITGFTGGVVPKGDLNRVRFYRQHLDAIVIPEPMAFAILMEGVALLICRSGVDVSGAEHNLFPPEPAGRGWNWRAGKDVSTMRSIDTSGAAVGAGQIRFSADRCVGPPGTDSQDIRRPLGQEEGSYHVVLQSSRRLLAIQ